MFASGTWREAEVQVDPGDLLLLYSDGAHELFDTEGNELGVPGLERLALEQIAGTSERDLNLQTLAEQLLRFTNQIHLADDLTLLKLRRNR